MFKDGRESNQAKDLLKNFAKSITQIVAPTIAVNETIHVCEKDHLDVEAACHLLKGLLDLNLSCVPLTGCSGLMEPDTFMRDNIVNHRGVNNDAKTQLQAVPEGV